jgi:hypothetical protein
MLDFGHKTHNFFAGSTCVKSLRSLTAAPAKCDLSGTFNGPVKAEKSLYKIPHCVASENAVAVYILQLSVGQAYSRAGLGAAKRNGDGSSVASPHQTVPPPKTPARWLKFPPVRSGSSSKSF